MQGLEIEYLDPGSADGPDDPAGAQFGDLAAHGFDREPQEVADLATGHG